MSTSILDFKVRLQSKIHGKSLNKIQDIEGLIFEAAGNLLGKIDPQETIRISQIENALYDNVFDYVIPPDLKKDKVIDIRPQANRSPSSNFNLAGGEQFDQYKTNNSFAIRNNTGVRTLRISKALTAGLEVEGCDSLTDNGTWTAGGNGTSLEADSLNKITSSGSLRFNISASGATAYIENSTIASIDLSNIKDAGALFVWVYIPSVTIISAVDLRWGSSSSNYYSRSVTSSHDNTSFIVGWNLLRFDWDGSTETGTPDEAAIDYVRVTLTYNGTAVNSVRVDSITAKLGSIFEIEYFSTYLFRSLAGTWKEKPTLDTDLINLDMDAANLLLYETAELIAQELQGEDSSFDLNYWINKKQDVWKTYQINNKSQAQKKRLDYYRTSSRRR